MPSTLKPVDVTEPEVVTVTGLSDALYETGPVTGLLIVRPPPPPLAETNEAVVGDHQERRGRASELRTRLLYCAANDANWVRSSCFKVHIFLLLRPAVFALGPAEFAFPSRTLNFD